MQILLVKAREMDLGLMFWARIHFCLYSPFSLKKKKEKGLAHETSLANLPKVTHLLSYDFINGSPEL